MSFAAFKRDMLDAFEGEPVQVRVRRTEQRFSVELRTADEAYFVLGSTTDAKAPDRPARRAWALALFKDFVETVAEHKKAAAADVLRERFGATVQ